jgi:hypothetical protein
VREQRLEEGPLLVHFLQQGEAGVRPFSSQAFTAEPKPYHPGSIRRHCAQPNTQGMARRSSMRREFVREAGRLPMFRLAISPMTVNSQK